MKIALFADKASAILAWTKPIQAFFPQIDHEQSIAFAVHPYHEQQKFVLPKNLRASDFPFAGTPSFRKVDLVSPVTYSGENGEITLPRARDLRGQRIEVTSDDCVQRLMEADIIVDAMDSWPSRQALFELIMSQYFPAGVPTEKIIAPFSTSLHADQMIEQLSEADRDRGLERMNKLISYGRSKWRFQYGFIVNSNAILKSAMRLAGCDASAPPLSPFSLQLLYALKRSGPLVHWKIVSLMSYWTGTGRYPRHRDDGIRMTTFGGPASRSLIINNLEQANLLVRVGHGYEQRVLGLSHTGERLLELLHPDCEDPDLSFRLDEWFQLPEPEAHSKIDRYLRTFFGKQMRFQGGLSPAASELAWEAERN